MYVCMYVCMIGMQLLSNGDLLISDVAWPDNMGLYYCKVQNNVSSQVVDMFVYPVCIPPPLRTL